MNAAAELRNVRKRRGRFRLGPADLALEQGLVTAVVGPNGSGKTTLFRMIVGEQQPDEGDVSVPKKLTIGYFRQDVDDHGAGLRARAAVARLELDSLVPLGLPPGVERLVHLPVQLARRIVGHVEQRRLGLRRSGSGERRHAQDQGRQ